ncbi:hypothetical protein Zm00014a_025611 [Zea mays]|uniref:Uncharacterized protein n=1 Tax=Zea mays TaxID=4577 RepID=A0A3L6F7I2_MAIZE|nr:hypothetical protein Zm00014a_025611 [Zea mays]
MHPQIWKAQSTSPNWKARSRSSNHNNYPPNFALALIKKVAIPSSAHHRPLTPFCTHQRPGDYSSFAPLHGKYSRETRVSFSCKGIPDGGFFCSFGGLLQAYRKYPRETQADVPEKEMDAKRTRCQ